MKKITAALLLAGMTTAASAHVGTGFFVGVNASAGAMLSKIEQSSNTHAVTGGGAAGTLTSKKWDGGKLALGAGLEAGYGMTFNKVWLAGSIYGGIISAKQKQEEVNAVPAYTIQSSKLESKYRIGGEVKLGYFLTKDTVGFVGVALEGTKYKFSWFDGHNGNDGKVIASKSKTLVTPVFSLGMRTFVTNNMYVEGKARMSIQRKITSFNTGEVLVGGANVLDYPYRDVKVRAQTTEFVLTVGYKF